MSEDADVDYLMRLQGELNEARAERDAAYKQAGDLSEGMAKALGLPWRQSPYGGSTCPDDKDIIAAAERLKAEVARLKGEAAMTITAGQAVVDNLKAESGRIENALDDISSRIRMLGLRIERDTSRPTKRHVRMWVTELHGISEDARKAALYNIA